MSFATISMKLSKIVKWILDCLFPVQCLNCRREGEWLCAACLASVPIRNKILTDFIQPSFLDQVIAITDYNQPLLKKALHLYKYRFIVAIGKDLARLIELNKIGDYQGWLLIPIPLHRRRLKQREFNQSEIIARAISQKFGLKLETETLRRRRYTKPQMSLNREQRLKNLTDVFICDSDVSNYPGIILVDDVLTTGATLNEAAKALRLAGAKQVIGLVIAHGE